MKQSLHPDGQVLMPADSLEPLNVVLLEPEIPPNTGNVARLCAATRSRLHLIEPLGFQLTDRELKRAGMDYWQHVDWRRWPDWVSFRRAVPPEATVWLIESGASRTYAEVMFRPGDFLVFGRETAGIPRQILEDHRETCLRIPMFNPAARSLNLSNCVALVVYEALRQRRFSGAVE